MLVLAHRGYHVEHPENTLAAFDAAVRVGADGIETDVRVTSDGVPILFHDRVVQGIEVAALSRAELIQRTGRAVPTLLEALDNWPDIFWNLEIKTPIDHVPLWPILTRFRDRRRLLISSFWHPLALRFGRYLALDCGLLVAHRPTTLKSLLVGIPNDLPVDRWSVIWEYASADPELISEAASGGVKSYVYGPQTQEDHARVAGWDLAGLITDHPTRVFPRAG